MYVYRSTEDYHTSHRFYYIQYTRDVCRCVSGRGCVCTYVSLIVRYVCKVLKFSVSNSYPIIQFGAFILSSAMNRRQGDIQDTTSGYRGYQGNLGNSGE